MEYPNFSFEKKVWQKGYKFIAGCDEVGRGCFAGPVVAGVVVFSARLTIEEGIVINDSKKIKPKVREKTSIWIKKNALAWGVGVISVTKINIWITQILELKFTKEVLELKRSQDTS